MGRLSILSKIIDVIAPRTCAICDVRLSGDEDTICARCHQGLPLTDTFLDTQGNEMARLFWGQFTPERCIALFYYKSHAPASQLIYKLKYGYRPEIGRFIGKDVAKEAQAINFFEGIDLLVPIPLSKKRRRQRGYNQSEEIALGISDLTHIPLCTQAVERTSFAQSQTHQHRQGRIDNVEGVFRLIDANVIEGKHLLLIDDICTTGATLISCAKQLLLAKDVRVSILTIGFAKH